MISLRNLSSLGLVLVCAGAAWALTDRRDPSRFDAKAIDDPGAVIGIKAIDTRTLPQGDPLRAGWQSFSAQNGGWDAFLDERTGLPTLASGHGIEWFAGPGNNLPAGNAPTIDQLEALARQFLEQHALLLGNWKPELALDRAATVQLNDRSWQVTLRQAVDGVPVFGARYDFHIVQGNLVAFGAYAIGRVAVSPTPDLSRDEARTRLDAYLAVGPSERLEQQFEPLLQLKPLDPRGDGRAAWDGARGQGLVHRLVWKFSVHVAGETPEWVAEVDAHDGSIVSFYDDTRYEQLRGGVYPLSNDGVGPSGQEQPNFPMPFAEYTEDGGAVQYAGDEGLYSCSSLGSSIRTTLNGKYIRISDNCGPVNQTTLCDDYLNLGSGPGTDCAVPPGSSPGNTHSSRSAFYHLNLVMAKGRAWLPNNAWLKSQVTSNVNISSTCNAFWDGSVNFYRSGGGCGNTGELQGVFVHEWGHGLDQNDGGGYDNTSESYADVVAIFEARLSCVGRGFYLSQTCSGYGDTCLTCTGIRDMDWNARTQHTPATPQNFLTNNCGGGGGPCGKEVHCESYPSSEAMFDLATRDLTAIGLDADSAWQTAERLFYQSRNGSGGNAYNCSLPTSDGCGTNSWYHKLRVADDDDGNLNNGTPHAKAIFDAFARHNLACGTAADATNKNSTGCPSLAKPVITQAKGLSNSVELTWGAVSGAGKYRILRNDLGCTYAQVIVGEVNAPTTTFTDDLLANEQPVYYRVQALGSNSACESPVSACTQAAGQPLAGSVKFDQSTYSCSRVVGLRVKDANAAPGSITVKVWSDSEPAFETVTLTQSAPGASTYSGTILSTPGPAVHGDGQLSIKNADVMHVEYIDVNDGSGGVNVVRQATATADCVLPQISSVADTNVSDTAATITWQTNEIADTVLLWGPLKPPTTSATGDPRTTAHSINLSGLQGCTVYWYEARSTDPAGNLAIANNGAQYYHFETLGNFGDGLQPCHGGRVTINQSVVSCSDTATFRVIDLDLNLNPQAIDTTVLRVTSSTETQPELVVVTETGVNTSRFEGSIQTLAGAPLRDGKLQTSHGDTLTVTYADSDDGTGTPATSYDTSVLDCVGPGASALGVNNITNARGTISFNTSEPSTTVVDWGTTPALGQTSSDLTLTTSHATVLNQFNQCQRVYFRVRTADTFGNQTIIDNAGQPFSFDTGLVPGVYYQQNFENGLSGWTLQGEWQIDTPQGVGGGDPSRAYNNSKALGHDLTGLGANPGNYEPNLSSQVARTPTFNATAWRSTKLIFYRGLSVEPNDDAQLWVFTPQGVPVYRSEGSFVSDNGYLTQSFDLTGVVDGKAAVFFEFRQRSNATDQRGGWTVDDFILKDGRLADYAACGSCGAAPAFAGATRAFDTAPCGAGGVQVDWSAAVSWGSGATGTYAIYRSTSPSFTPSPATLIVDGVSGTTYLDTTAPATGTLYYIVRAENNEACSTGPNNNGVTDSNTVRVSATTSTSQAAAGTVNTLSISLVNHAHLRLSWQSSANSTSYRVLRSTTPQPGGFAPLIDTAATLYEDLDEGASAQNYFYLVRGLNGCGQESP